jgi:hypothetical protein
MKSSSKKVIVLIGAGSIGIAIARRVGAGKHIVIADIKQESNQVAANILNDAGFETSISLVDLSSKTSLQELVKTATGIGDITGLIIAAGLSPSQASPQKILEVDLYGTAVALEEFGNVISQGGSAIVIASQSGHRLPPLSKEENEALALTPTKDLLSLPFLQLEMIRDSLHAYQLSKRGNSLRTMSEAIRWGKRGARVNCISPGIIITPLANDELAGPRGEMYRNMIQTSPVGRAGTPDEVASLAELLMGEAGTFITGSDFLMDGGVTASYWYGDLKPNAQ